VCRWVCRLLTIHQCSTFKTRSCCLLTKQTSLTGLCLKPIFSLLYFCTNDSLVDKNQQTYCKLNISTILKRLPPTGSMVTHTYHRIQHNIMNSSIVVAIVNVWFLLECKRAACNKERES